MKSSVIREPGGHHLSHSPYGLVLVYGPHPALTWTQISNQKEAAVPMVHSLLYIMGFWWYTGTRHGYSWVSFLKRQCHIKNNYETTKLINRCPARTSTMIQCLRSEVILKPCSSVHGGTVFTGRTGRSFSERDSHSHQSRVCVCRCCPLISNRSRGKVGVIARCMKKRRTKVIGSCLEETEKKTRRWKQLTRTRTRVYWLQAQGALKLSSKRLGFFSVSS